MIMAVASPQVELLISLFFSEDDVNFSYVSYISTSGITTLHTQDIFLEKIKNHANNLIGDLIFSSCSNLADSISCSFTTLLFFNISNTGLQARDNIIRAEQEMLGVGP